MSGTPSVGRKSPSRSGGSRPRSLDLARLQVGSEHQLQVALFRWAALAQRAHPELRWMFAVPNAGKRSPAAGRWMRAEGLRPGVPDVWLPVPRGPHPGLVIEHKFDNNKLTEEQLAWIDGMAELGWRTLVSYSFERSRQAIVDYLGGK